MLAGATLIPKLVEDSNSANRTNIKNAKVPPCSAWHGHQIEVGISRGGRRIRLRIGLSGVNPLRKHFPPLLNTETVKTGRPIVSTAAFSKTSKLVVVYLSIWCAAAPHRLFSSQEAFRHLEINLKKAKHATCFSVAVSSTITAYNSSIPSPHVLLLFSFHRPIPSPTICDSWQIMWETHSPPPFFNVREA